MYITKWKSKEIQKQQVPTFLLEIIDIVRDKSCFQNKFVEVIQGTLQLGAQPLEILSSTPPLSMRKRTAAAYIGYN